MTAPPAGRVDPLGLPKFTTALPIPPAHRRHGVERVENGPDADYYELSARQALAQVLPVATRLKTTVFAYGDPSFDASYTFPGSTIEVPWGRWTRIKWRNDLAAGGRFRPHLLPVDQTLHWANPPGGIAHRDYHGHDPAAYAGPVPLVTHVHGSNTFEDSDGYPEAWYLPAAADIPATYARQGSSFDRLKASAARRGASWGVDAAVSDYPNDQRATSLWYHDHTLGMTRTNVYAGLLGFYIIRGGPHEAVTDAMTGGPGVLPGPAPAAGDRPGTAHYEIPMVLTDRSFNPDGSWFYPAARTYFDGFGGPYLPDPASDISPIWNPEFFGDCVLVNGVTWPRLAVEQRRYRFRLLNGSGSRFFILRMSNGTRFWQIGADGGLLPAPVQLDRLLMAPAERADVIVDFSGVPVGTEIHLENVGPDEPFGGGEPGIDFVAANPATTGQVMVFRVGPAAAPDPSTPPYRLVMPAIPGIGPVGATRAVSLNEEVSGRLNERGGPLGPGDEPAGPRAALLGTLDTTGAPISQMWSAPVTEVATAGVAEIWEVHNFTEDAHPIHLHQTQFSILNRAPMHGGPARPPEPWETGRKDTVIAYPGEVTRIAARFDRKGRFVWHCHILEHEDQEMMRPFDVV